MERLTTSTRSIGQTSRLSLILNPRTQSRRTQYGVAAESVLDAVRHLVERLLALVLLGVEQLALRIGSFPQSAYANPQ